MFFCHSDMISPLWKSACSARSLRGLVGENFTASSVLWKRRRTREIKPIFIKAWFFASFASRQKKNDVRRNKKANQKITLEAMCTFKAKWRSRFSGNVCSVINLSPPTEGTKGRVTLINKTNSYPHNFPLLTLDVFSVLSRAKRRSRLSGDPA